MADRLIAIDDEEFALATLWQRVGGGVIDWVVLFVVFLTFALMSGLDFFTGPFELFSTRMEVASASPPLWYAAVEVAIGAIYFVYLIGTRGKTLGKMAFGTRVVSLDHAGVPGYHVAFMRWALPGIAGMLTFWSNSATLLSLVIYLPILFQDRRQGAHDLVAKTYVIKG